MTTNTVSGSIKGIYRFPVKSMDGEQLVRAELTNQGIPGDRAYALVDNETGKVVSAKQVRLFPDILKCKATFIHEPQAGEPLPPVLITFPQGSTSRSDAEDVDEALSAHFNRDVSLVNANELNAADEQSMLHSGSFFDDFPLSVLTTATLRRLSKLQPDLNFDVRRFRMNLIVETSGRGFVENDWVGHELKLGNRASLSIARPDRRCVMTTLAQNDLPAEPEMLRALLRHNPVETGDSRKHPAAGVYAGVTINGQIKVGDTVVLKHAASPL
jgi:uncharacterized protein YcbX